MLLSHVKKGKEGMDKRRKVMKGHLIPVQLAMIFMISTGCASSYKAQPLPFKAPSGYPNATEVAGFVVGAKAFADPKEAKEAFGFDVLAAGMLPVQVVLDNQGRHPLVINGSQTFLEDGSDNLWPLLDSKTAYERATKYAQTKSIFKEGAYSAMLGTAAGAVIGAAIGVVTGEDVAIAAGKGAAAGAAGGATIGGIRGYGSDDARHDIIDDLNGKTLQNKPMVPGNLSYGVLFFPGEAASAKELRLQLKETDTGKSYTIKMRL